MDRNTIPKVPLSRDELRQVLFGERIKALFPEFEVRRPQLEMIKTIINAFNESQVAIVEAGTGTGKSLAYLVPAILFADQNNTKVVISTFTKSLQHQLIEKDIPLALKILDLKTKYNLIKGKKNYLCFKRFYETLEFKNQYESLFDKSQQEQFEKELEIIELWLEKTKTGDLEELAKESIYNLYQEVYTDGDLCTHHRCPHFHQCFFYKSKEKIEQSSILVVNHSLLVSHMELNHLEIENDLIPEFDYLIIDEAHNFVKSILIEEHSSFLGILKTINRIYTFQNQRGVINQFVNILTHQEQKNDPIKDSILGLIDDEVKSSIAQFKQNTEIFFSQLYFAIQNQITNPKDPILLFKNLKSGVLDDLQDLFNEMVSSSHMLAEMLSLLLDKLGLLQEEFNLEHQTKIKMIAQIEKKLEMDFSLWQMIFEEANHKNALWFELSIETENIALHYVNLNNEEFLNQTLYDPTKSIVMTSATLGIGKSLSFFKEQIHLQKDTLDQILPTPFHYKNQCLFMVPKDIASPSGSDSLNSPFILDSIQFIENILKSTQRKTLILCTSFHQMNLICEKLKDSIKAPIFKQNSLSYQKLVEEFKKSDNGVLIGVDTFWEGIDLPGDHLELLIIVKLPFKPPYHPVTQTIYDIVEKEGDNPFIKVSVPEAIIKFKQGFGRLIRSKEDKGVVICLDNRLIEKHYGKQFLHSLPTGAYYYPQETVIKKTLEFLNDSQAGV